MGGCPKSLQWWATRCAQTCCLRSRSAGGRFTLLIRAPRDPESVWSRSEVGRIDPEPVRLVCPGFADELVGREAPQGLEPAGGVIGLQKELQMRPQPIVAVVVIAPHRRVLEGAVHPLDLTIIRHDGCGAFRVQLFSFESSLMVSPSGTRGTGSTKVRAGRR